VRQSTELTRCSTCNFSIWGIAIAGTTMVGMGPDGIGVTMPGAVALVGAEAMGGAGGVGTAVAIGVVAVMVVAVATAVVVVMVVVVTAVAVVMVVVVVTAVAVVTAVVVTAVVVVMVVAVATAVVLVMVAAVVTAVAVVTVEGTAPISGLKRTSLRWDGSATGSASTAFVTKEVTTQLMSASWPRRSRTSRRSPSRGTAMAICGSTMTGSGWSF
jgi:hypothetical protein